MATDFGNESYTSVCSASAAAAATATTAASAAVVFFFPNQIIDIPLNLLTVIIFSVVDQIESFINSK